MQTSVERRKHLLSLMYDPVATTELYSEEYPSMLFLS